MSKIKQIFSKFAALPSQTAWSGVTEESLAPMVLRELLRSDAPALIVVPTLAVAERLESELILWLRELEAEPRLIARVPDPSGSGRFNPETEILRTRLAHRMRLSPPPVTIGTPVGLFSAAIPSQQVTDSSFTISTGDTFDLSALLARLVEMDYDDEPEVNLPGEFARRGGIVDLFSPSEEYPVRIEFFGDTIDSMRRFAVQTQRSINEIQSYVVASKTIPDDPGGDDIFTCISPHNPRILLLWPDACDTAFARFGDPRRLDAWTTLSLLTETNIVRFHEGEMESAPPADALSVLDTLSRMPEEAGASEIQLVRRVISENIKSYVKEGYKIVATVHDRRNESAVRAWIGEPHLADIKIDIAFARIPAGIVFHGIRTVLLSEREIFYTPHRRRQPVIPDDTLPASTRTITAIPDTFAELDTGDYVVHLLHGIGRFIDIREVTIDGITDEVMVLEFDEDAKLYVPIWQAGLVSRYAGTGKQAPKLHKLSGRRWDNMKVEALAAMRKLAAELLRIQAARSAVKGFQFPPDLPEQDAFEASFPYNETPDQRRAIAETKADMESDKPMDRLICGDVGYGKTEVAVRAVFKAVASGYQAAILVPTTILAQQHYYTLCERFSEYPIVVEMLSRFRSPAEHRDVLQRLKSGGVDVIVGTHRLLQRDVEIPNIGLLVIDEEQRFGVEHKEKLKRFRTALDILTLSATPIPRTLYMSMTGLRDLSTIITAPERRLPVETIVAKHDDIVIAEAIRRELRRGGQAFFLHNRVRTIEKTCAKLQSLVPEARFLIGHGQMDDHELEQVMADFIDGKADVLVCTTIIESGVDIPNVNTIIIADAHRFGISELYQLRGRVGRWTRQAYAYFLLPVMESLSSDARKRMAAIRKYSQLGAGFRLAMKDLEIRGSGNLLGAEQSGHIANLGFDLYCRLLRETVARLKKEPVPILPEAELRLDFLRFALKAPTGILTASIPPDYVPTLRHRIDIHRQFANAASNQSIDAIADELRDRFGPLPESVKTLITAYRIKLLAAECNFRVVRNQGRALILEFATDRYYRDLNDSLPIIPNTNPKRQLDAIIATLTAIRTSQAKGS